MPKNRWYITRGKKQQGESVQAPKPGRCHLCNNNYPTGTQITYIEDGTTAHTQCIYTPVTRNP